MFELLQLGIQTPLFVAEGSNYEPGPKFISLYMRKSLLMARLLTLTLISFAYGVMTQYVATVVPGSRMCSSDG